MEQAPLLADALPELAEQLEAELKPGAEPELADEVQSVRMAPSAAAEFERCKRLPVALLVAAALLMACGQKNDMTAQIHECRITGRVVDTEGNGVEAQVTVKPHPDPGSTIGYTSDASGALDIGVECNRTYELIAGTTDAESDVEKVSVDDEEAVVELVLDRSLD